jgi:hypothetical protein
MPCAIVGDMQFSQGGLLTHVKNDRLNHLIHTLDTLNLMSTKKEAYLSNARMTQSWYPHSGFRPSPILSACACNTSLSSCASPYILSNGRAINASSSSPGFSYLVGIDDNVIIKLRNFCDTASVGGDGIMGRLRNDEYEGGVAPMPELLDVDGRTGRSLIDGDGGGRELEEACARRFEDDALSRGDGDGLRERDRSSSVSRLFRSNCSNCTLKSLAHS